MNKTLFFIYRFKFTQPENASNKTSETDFYFSNLNLKISELLKVTNLSEDYIKNIVLPLFENEFSTCKDSKEKELNILFNSFVQNNPSFEGIEQIEIVKIILL